MNDSLPHAPRYLTKSRFKIALDCPAKLYYHDHPDYPAATEKDPFLMALQDGGFQVGELARLYHPGGILVKEIDAGAALAATARLMKHATVVLFEPAFSFNGLFVRVDVLEKSASRVILKEVKSRSIDPTSDSLTTRRGDPRSKWKDLLSDVAFQTYVLRQAHPELIVEPFLTLCDKSVRASVDALNQLFKVDRLSERTVEVRLTEDDVTAQRLGNPVLADIPVGTIVDSIIADPAFEERVGLFRDAHQARDRMNTEVGRKCRTCEYRIPDQLISENHLSGFQSCWSGFAGFSDQDFHRPHVLDIGNFDWRRVDEALGAGTYFMDEVPRDVLSERNLHQVLCETDSDHPAEHVDERLFDEMQEWTFPLHMIDFETATAAIPFFEGQRPYQLIAFQFSCHDIHEDGTVVHRGEWIAPNPDRMPNVAFLRALKAVLDEDDGTIFQYSHHENTVLNQIYDLLDGGSESGAEDAAKLKKWIREITNWKDDEGTRQHGPRAMVDLCEFVKKYYYHRRMRGSNSIKKVLPAVLETSDAIEGIYSLPYHGSNFPEGIVWYQRNTAGAVIDPYDLLPELEQIRDDDDPDVISSGGVAATAFARMQFTDMPDEERERLTGELLRYCELDTLAMVMLYQHFVSLQN